MRDSTPPPTVFTVRIHDPSPIPQVFRCGRQIAKLEANASHVEALNALAHLTRLQAFFFLARVKGEVSVSEIQEAVEVPGPTLSHHLDVLRRAGLVESRRHERYIYYSVQRETVTALVRLLTACC